MKKIIIILSLLLSIAKLSANQPITDTYMSPFYGVKNYHFVYNSMAYKIISDTSVALVNPILDDHYRPSIKDRNIPDTLIIPAKVPYNGKEYTVTVIGDVAMRALSSKKITLPETLIKIYHSAFLDYTCDSLIIPNSVKEIGDGAFAFSTLRYIKLPSQLKKINKLLCYYCQKLNKVELSDDIEDIGYRAFMGCFGMKINSIPKNLRFIGKEVFKYCTAFDSITFHDNLEIIDLSAFEGCRNLIYVHFPKSIKQIKGDAFKECLKLSDVTFESPSNLESIQNAAFINCKQIKNLVLPEGLKTIWNYAFNGCSLKVISLPKSVESIANAAFGCDNWSVEVRVFWNEPLIVSDVIFRNLNYLFATLIVPPGTVEKYKVAPVWKNFLIKEGDSSNIDTHLASDLLINYSNNMLSITGEVKSNLSIYNTNGELLYTCGAFSGERSVPLPLGIYIIIADGKFTKQNTF